MTSKCKMDVHRVSYLQSKILVSDGSNNHDGLTQYRTDNQKY
jgi:hypothetical protein